MDNMNHAGAAHHNGTAAATPLVGNLLLDGSAAKQNELAAAKPLVPLDADAAKQSGSATARPLVGQNGSAAATPLPMVNRSASATPLVPLDAGAARQNGSAVATPLVEQNGSAAAATPLPMENGSASATPLMPLDAGAAKQNGSAAATPLVRQNGSAAAMPLPMENGTASATPLVPLDAGTTMQNGTAAATPLIGQNGSAAATPLVPLDPDKFRQQGRLVVDFIADYYTRIHQYPVRPTVAPGFLARHLPDAAPFLPEPNAFASALHDVGELILPGVTHWQSPHHFAHFAATASNVGALGEALAAGLNINPFTWAASPAATELEVVVTDWLGKALNLPHQLLFCGGGGGTLLGTSCEAVLCTIVAARNRKLAEIGEERIGDLVVYCSDQTHFSFIKAARIAGIRRDNCREIHTCPESGFALSPNALRAAVLADEASGRVPLFLCATVGTTPSAAVDPIRELCTAVAGHDVWVHVDAAYAGAACVCPEFVHTIGGAEAVDSFSTNPHKWLLANMDCCALWVRRPTALVAALGTDDVYILKDATSLGHANLAVDYKDWQVALTRRFRALKLWLVLRCHGIEGLRSFVRSHVRMAATFEGMVRADGRFELPVPTLFALVCFRLRPATLPEGNTVNDLNKKLLEAVNATGRAYMSCAVLGDMYVLRCAIGNSLTEDRHVLEAWSVVQEQATAILASS